MNICLNMIPIPITSIPTNFRKNLIIFEKFLNWNINSEIHGAKIIIIK